MIKKFMIYIFQKTEIFLLQLEQMEVFDNSTLEIYNTLQYNIKLIEEDQS